MGLFYVLQFAILLYYPWPVIGQSTSLVRNVVALYYYNENETATGSPMYWPSYDAIATIGKDNNIIIEGNFPELQNYSVQVSTDQFKWINEIPPDVTGSGDGARYIIDRKAYCEKLLQDMMVSGVPKMVNTHLVKVFGTFSTGQILNVREHNQYIKVRSVANLTDTNYTFDASISWTYLSACGFFVEYTRTPCSMLDTYCDVHDFVPLSKKYFWSDQMVVNQYYSRHIVQAQGMVFKKDFCGALYYSSSGVTPVSGDFLDVQTTVFRKDNTTTGWVIYNGLFLAGCSRPVEILKVAPVLFQNGTIGGLAKALLTSGAYLINGSRYQHPRDMEILNGLPVGGTVTLPNADARFALFKRRGVKI